MKIIRPIMSLMMSHLWIIRKNAFSTEHLKRKVKFKLDFFFIILS
jgi:cytosine/uracil/thiamine/allantoin permease